MTVIVHSWNPSGAKIMIDTMRDNGVKCHYFAFQDLEFLSAVRQINEQVESRAENEKETDNSRVGEDI